MRQSDKSKAFLEVSDSLGGQHWVERLPFASRNAAIAISQEQVLPALVGRVLAGRGVAPQEAASFLDPSIRSLMPDPDCLTDMQAACDRLVRAIRSGEKIAVFGDYDVDGACASAIISRFLCAHGLLPRLYIPDRIFEGYGPNADAIRRLRHEGVTLLVTVDCGATSFEALQVAHEIGLDVVVLDHHQTGVELPCCEAHVNPNRQDDLSGLDYLCAAGVVFMTLVAVTRALRSEGVYSNELPAPDLLVWLDLVALATVCDVVPLKGLNRAFVVKGLQVMALQKNPGLKALMQVGRLDGPPHPYHLGFVLGPRINAGGRIGDAALGARLLSDVDPQEAMTIANRLDTLNHERQQAEVVMLEEAMAEANAEFARGTEPSILITSSQNWHPGIVGLLASRLKDRFRRPAFAIAFNPDGSGAGSGRSIAGVDLGAAVRMAVDLGLLEKGGGHAMAAGLSVHNDKLGALRDFFEERLGDAVKRAGVNQQLKIDGALTARGASLDLIDLLEKAGPYGQGHSQPVFAFPAHQIRFAKTVGAGHVSFTASAGDGAKLRGIAFRCEDTPIGKALLSNDYRPIHLAGTLNANFWQGSRRVQLRLIDAAYGE